MAINSCSINAFTINSLKCRRRVFDINPPIIVNGGQVQQYRYQNWQEDEEIFDINNLELSTFRVEIMMNGKSVGYSLVDNDIDKNIVMTSISGISVSPVTIDIKSISVKEK